MNQQPDSPLANLQKLEEYQQRTAHLFPGLHSLRWFIRQRKAQLVAAGALLYIAGRLWVNPSRFDACVLQAGSELPQSAAAREAS
ncbi:hypothetical protein LJR130_003022 [Variovorax sp. LjRoot130]|uniref:hypothetical protein n=1 Tax=Variovorax sp. LjRoot130 TaxID=3342261 RepID=UPI003ECFC435